MGGSTSQETKYSWKSTAAEVGKDNAAHAVDKFVIVTGANVGLGMETCRVLARHGANITLACRNLKLGEEAIQKLKEENPDAKLELRQLDLGSLQSVRDFAREYRESGRELHLLINNAGVMACPKSYTKDDLETQLGVNHLGHFLLTNELLDVLKRSGKPDQPARVVNLASIANYLFAPSEGIRLDDLHADKSYHTWERYGASKLANIVFSKELNRRLQAEKANVISVSLHPGVIMETNLMRYSHNISNMAGLVASMRGFSAMSAMASEPSKNIPQGAATTVLCALSPDIIPGEYYSDCNVCKDLLHPKANDEELGRKFWEESEKIVYPAK